MSFNPEITSIRTAYIFPFAALVGQKEMKTALLLSAIDPGLGGVLLRGEKGTAKSTAARALAALLPPREVVAGCALGCDPAEPWCPQCRQAPRPLAREMRPTPFVDLPLGATEDRVSGSVDLEAAIKQGRLSLAPGLLAQAHGGVLYIDEVNLLPGHIAALVLDAAAWGRARVEREGLSLEHPARFVLLASYNPEEGPLGPQLTDRFGLCVRVRGLSDPGQRVELIQRRLAFEADPEGFAAQWAPAQAELARRVILARERLPQVEAARPARLMAARLAARARAQGQRGELACLRAARALAAWQGLDQVDPELVGQVAPLALIHRSRPDQASPVRTKLRQAPLPGESPPAQPAKPSPPQSRPQGAEPASSQGISEIMVLPPDPVRPIATRAPAREGTCQHQAGRRASRQTPENRGRYLRASSQRLGRSLAFDATLRAAAPHQKARRVPGGPALVVRPPDVREKVRAARRGRLLLFCVDASGSMNAAARMRETKSAVLGLLTEAYQKRDRVGLVAFGGSSALELLPPTSSVEVARRMLAELPTGGKTPLAAGMVALAQVLARELSQDARLSPLAVILSDGRPNVPLDATKAGAPAGNKGGGWGDGWGDGGYADREVLNLARQMSRDSRVRFVVVDTDTGHHHESNLCAALAQYLGGPRVSLAQVSAEQVLDLVRAHW